MRSVLNSFPSIVILVSVVGGTAVAAMGAVLVARRLSPALADGPFEEVADGLRVVYELVFALVLAFVISSVLDTFSTAEAVVAEEATTLAQLKRDAQGLPIQHQIDLDEVLNHYVHAIAESEWETMRDGRESPQARAALESLYALYQNYSPPPADGAEAEFYAQGVDLLQEAASARRARIGLSNADLPLLLRLFLPLGVALLLVLEYRPRMALRAQLTHIGLLAVVVSFPYLLTILLNYPFAGDVSVSNQPFKQGALSEYWPEPPHVLAKGERVVPLDPAQLEGVWSSDAFGVIVFRAVGNEVRAVYRAEGGAVAGTVAPDGVFRGSWCDEPTRRPSDDGGDVEWRLVRSSGDEVAYGTWRYGSEEPYRGGWDLRKVGGPVPPDLAPRFDDPSAFCRRP